MLRTSLQAVGPDSTGLETQIDDQTGQVFVTVTDKNGKTFIGPRMPAEDAQIYLSKLIDASSSIPKKLPFGQPAIDTFKNLKDAIAAEQNAAKQYLNKPIIEAPADAAAGTINGNITGSAITTAGSTTGSAAATSDPKTASTGTEDSDKTGDADASMRQLNLETAQAYGYSNSDNTNSEINVSSSSSAGTTTVGKAGDSKVQKSDGSGLLGRRMYNPLGDFSSYTYNIGLYLMDPNDYNAFIEGDHSIVNKFQLIVQSGGITEGVNSPRATGFDLDFYIDNLEITTLTNSKETGDSSNSVNCSFQVIEPYGFTFPTKLINAVKASNSNKTSANKDTGAQATLSSLQSHFMLMIKFYGYDINGKLISGKDYLQADTKRSDDQAVFERAFPIIIKKFNFKLDNKTVVYNIQAVLISEQIGKGVKRGRVQTSKPIVAKDVKSALDELVKILNDQQTEGLNRKPNPIIGVADQYAIEFEGNGWTLPSSKIVSKEHYNKSTVPLYDTKNTEGVNVRASQGADVINTKERTIQIGAGMSIFQAIDTIITQSSYVEDALKAIDIEQVQSVQPSDPTIDVNKQPTELCWYNITPQVTWLDHDKIRQDSAYKITYKIQQYKIPYIRSVSHGYSSKYYGPHKQYQYWFTGKNTEILSYEQNYNLLYFTAISMSSSTAPANSSGAVTRAPTPGQDADITSQLAGALDAVGSVKSFLYSPGDALHFQLKILGDPDYLMPAVSGSVNTLLQKFKFYGDDFTINPNSGQVFIEIKFQQTEDYSNMTGLLNPDDDIMFLNYPDNLKNQIKGMTYMVKKVISHFNKGQFTQDVSGYLPDFAVSGNGNTGTTGASGATREQTKPVTTVQNTNSPASGVQRGSNNSANTPAAGGNVTPNQSAAETQRLNNAAAAAAARTAPSKSPDDDASYDALGNQTGYGKSTADMATGSRETAAPVHSRSRNNGGPVLGRGSSGTRVLEQNLNTAKPNLK